MMRTSASVRAKYQGLFADYCRVKTQADNLMASIKETQWHYESRLKELESYAQKLETGRYPSGEIDDFFAATFVVDNRATLRRAETKLTEAGHFVVVSRKPRDEGLTSHRASDFAFDDIRLYLKLAEVESRTPLGIESLVFEMQIKTFLQHAWSIATHDLIYKGDHIDWRKERIAFQVKAMLEHAEVTIEHAQRIASAEGEKSTQELKAQKDLLELVRRKWPNDQLPKDQTRMARNMYGLQRAAGVTLAELGQALDQATQEGRGTSSLSVSPYGALLDALVRAFPDRLARLQGGNLKVFVPEEQSDLRRTIPRAAVAGTDA